jgi:hypothetical protein
MNEKRIALFVVSVSSLSIWSLFSEMGLINGKLITLLVLVSVILFVYISTRILNDFKFENSYFKFIFAIYFCYELFIIARGWNFNYGDIKGYIQTGFVFWPFLIPVFIFFNKEIESFGLLLKWIYYLGVFFLVIIVLFPNLLVSRLTSETLISLIFPCGFLLLNAAYLKNRKVNLTFFIIFISILSLTYLARRSSLVTLLGFVTTAYFLNLFNKSKTKLFRIFPIIIIIGIFLLFSRYFDNSKEVLFNKIRSRISEDTRTGLFQMFYYDMRDNMLFGKGMNGTYYFPTPGAEVDGVVFEEVEYRNVIENGYLQLLLNGGIVQIALFLLILLPAAILGFFMSSNQFTKACGVLIVLRLIEMAFYGLPTLSLSYILIWICVGICYKKSIRRLTNEEIHLEFQKLDL